LTAIVILALVALFIGLRLYSVLGERTGHEQPILKPADPEQADARMEPRAAARASTPTASAPFSRLIHRLTSLDSWTGRRPPIA
jgi:predicted lipid-binding transport protein (Tim44 family)